MNDHNTKDRLRSRRNTQPSTDVAAHDSKNRKAKEETVPAKSANSGTTSHASGTTSTASSRHGKPGNSGSSEDNGAKKRPSLLQRVSANASISALSSGLSSSGSSTNSTKKREHQIALDKCLDIMVERIRIDQQKNLKTPAWASADKSYKDLVARVEEIDRCIAELEEERSKIIMVVLPERKIKRQQWDRRLNDLDKEGEELEKELEHYKGVLGKKDYVALGQKAKNLALKNRSKEEKERDSARDQEAEAREKKEWEAYDRKLEGNEPRKEKERETRKEKEREHRKGGGSDVESDSGRKRGKKAERPGQPGQSSQSQGSSLS